MADKTIQLRFRAVNRDIFEAIRDGKKKVETRAATARYKNIKVGDILRFVCGKDSFEKKVKRTHVFKSIAALVKKYQVHDINPFVNSKAELQKMYYSYPNYREKIKKFGIIAIEFFNEFS